MKVGAIVKANQPEVHKKLNKDNQNHKRKRRGSHEEHLSFRDYIEIMKHDSYVRHNGALKQR